MEPQAIDKKKEIVKFFLDKGILISGDFLDLLSKEENVAQIYQTIQGSNASNANSLLILNNEVKGILSKNPGASINLLELDKSKVLAEKKKNTKLYDSFVSYLQEGSAQKPSGSICNLDGGKSKDKQNIKILFNYTEPSSKRSVQDFVALFNARYKSISKLLQNRSEMHGLTSIGRLLNKRDRENISVIGIVADKSFTKKNNNIMLSLEDPTGVIKVLINKNRPELYEKAKDIVLDEVIGVVGVNGENIIFANELVWPDIPRNKELKKSPDEVYAVFLSDIHVGSSDFLGQEFSKFLKWINGEMGTEEQKEIAKKVKYLFIAGDFVDGVGIYPGQEKGLDIQDITLQYEECARLLKQVPECIQIIACGGNHDALRISEPQPSLGEEFAGALLKLKNLTFISNPGLVNVHSSETFPGFDVLLYHGYSFDYYAANVDGIRSNGGYERSDLLMKFLLQRRHLAPTHTSTLYIPDATKDPLVIDIIPDFFVSGHIHYSGVYNHRNITLICGSCWQKKTAFQEKVGHNPQPCRVPIVNLQTRAVKIMKFG